MAEKNLGDLRTKFKLDTESIDKLAKSVKGVRGDFEWLSKNLTKINTQLDKTLKTLQGIQKLGGLTGSAGPSKAAGGIELPLGSTTSTNNAAIQANTVDNKSYVGPTVNVFQAPQGGSAAGGAAGFSKTGAAMQAFNVALQTLDNRINSNYERSLSVDKLGVYYQQNKGITNNQYYHQMREPLQNQRLGYGGINTLLSMQASTGIEASKQASGIAGLRAMSGYSYSTGDMANMVQTLGSAPVNNRMTMMLGTGIYGVGGEQRGIDTVIKDITKNSGLTNAGVLKGARQSGSVTRTRLESMGVPPDMIDMVLDYADSNIAYQKKGGKGMYDTSNAQQRKMMGIEDNFATQAEETARTKEGRDENFYKRQADNYADMEKGIQKVTEMLGKFEEKLSGIVGVGVSTKGGMLRKGIGAAAFAGGALAAGTPFGVPLMMLGGTLMSGDPVSNDKNKGSTIPRGYGSARISLEDLSSDSSFSKLNSTFKQRLKSMFEANPNVGLGEGMRSETDQKNLFLSRYRKVTDGAMGDAAWNGEQYQHVSGATVAPPGSSMHELGLAADLVGDVDWVAQNADKYGLKSFGGQYGEPWHVQPAELPDSRGEYENQGSPWGRPAGASLGTPPGSVIGDRYFAAKNGSFAGGPGPITLAQRIDALNQSTGDVSSMSATSPTPTGTAELPGSTPVAGPSAEAISKADKFVQQALKSQGDKYVYATGRDNTNPDPTAFDCSGLVIWAAIQSGYSAPGFGNTNAEGLYAYTHKNSDGMTIDDAKKTKGALLFSRNEDNKIGHVAISLGDGTTMEAKGTDYGVGIFKERSTWTDAGMLPGMGSGDPMAGAPTRGGETNVKVGGATNVTIAPNIYVTSSGNTQQDARKMAQEIAQIMERELKKELLRSN